ncbi:MAG: hypothetical protein M1840_004682 [Geoglossum simile]|nr:MAG: hypothetical protein M1840_004682 [Geoglossum simile]
MALMLRTPWLRPVVEEKLGDVIRWRGTGASDRTRDGYQIIGDSVCVKMGGAKPLQIIKITTYEGQPRALLSDTASSIQATFSSTVFSADRATTKWCDRSVGGIVGIEDYELRIRRTDTAMLPKLVVYVRRANYLGSGGEGIFGNPISILLDQGINNLLVSISALGLTDTEIMESSADAEPMAHPRDGGGQPDEGLRELGSDEGSQNEFATQVRQSRPAPLSRPSSVLRNSGLGMKRRGIVSVMTAVDVSAKVRERAKANNLGLLLPRELGRDVPVAVSVARKAPKFPPTMSAKEAPAKTNRKDVQSCEPAPVLVTRAMDLAIEGTNHAEGSMAIGSVEANGHTGRAEIGKMSGANTSREVQTHLAGDEDLGINPWAGMTRISRREARIPEDQDELLSGKNCWIPPEPGNRTPIANIPVPILRALAAKAEESAMREKEAPGAAKNPSRGGSPYDSSSSSTSETGVELEWPPSPVRLRYAPVDEMPVDSSPEEASLTTTEFRSGVTNQPLDQGKGKRCRRKHEEIVSDNQDSSPVAKRQRKGERHKGGLGSEHESDGDFHSQGPPRDRSVKPPSSPVDWRDCGGGASLPAGGGAHLVKAPEMQGGDCDNPHGIGKSVSGMAFVSTFSPTDEGTRASQHTLYPQANTGAVVGVGHMESEQEIDSSNYPEACIDPIAEQPPRVVNAQERSPTSGEAIGEETDEENELETSFPAALGDRVDGVGLSYSGSLSSQAPPAASQPQKSVVVQVKQTPYLHSQGPKSSCGYGSSISLEETSSPNLHNGEDSSSDPVIPCTFQDTKIQVEAPVVRQKDELVMDHGSDEDSILISSQIEAEVRRRYPQLHTSNEINDRDYSSRGPETGLLPRGFMQARTLKGHGQKNLDNLSARASELGRHSRSPSGVSAPRPFRKDPVASASVSSHTPLRALLSSPAHMKAKVPSSVLDWLEKTSSVGSESADNVSDPQEQKWWHDRNTPFKEWCRAYASLKSVNGVMGKVDRETGNIIPPPVQMDVLGWSLP